MEMGNNEKSFERAVYNAVSEWLKDDYQINEITGEKILNAISDGVDRAIWRMITNATNAPCTDFYDTIESAAVKAFSSMNFDDVVRDAAKDAISGSAISAKT